MAVRSTRCGFFTLSLAGCCAFMYQTVDEQMPLSLICVQPAVAVAGYEALCSQRLLEHKA